MMESGGVAKSFNPRKIRKQTMLGIVLAGSISLGVSVLVFWGSLHLFPLTSRLPRYAGNGPNAGPLDWTTLGDFTNLITMSLFIGGIVFAFIEYSQNAIERRRQMAETSFNIYKEVYDRLMSSEQLKARRWIICNIEILDEAATDRKTWLQQVNAALDHLPEAWPGDRPPGREYLKQTLNTFDFIGFTADNYWSLDTELVEWMSPAVAKIWERIGPYVEEESAVRNEPDYYESARRFSQACVEWRRQHYPRSRFLKNAT